MTDLNTANARGIVTGLQGVGVVARQDIDVLLKTEPDCFNLFILALRELQNEKQDLNPPQWMDKMGYYQMAGIHGLPNKAWDNVRGKSDPTTTGVGYCHHGSSTFPTWHRPYLAMYEQALYKKMQDIAALYTDPARKTTYQNAVKKFRLPYIDYHRPRNYNATFPGVVNQQNGSTFYPYDFSVPQVITLENLIVKDYPNDTVKSIPNPLARYNFPSGSMSENEWRASGISPNADMKRQTMRFPLNRWSRYDPVTAMNAAINEIREDTVRLSLLFVENGGYNKYDDYATNGVRVRDPFDGRTVSGSLESIHGNYHVWLGGSGHMGQPSTAAFDPVFWLHHCTVDRWFAVWQKSHPGSWFDDGQEAAASLLPFRNTGNSFWSSNQSVNTETFGYTYPETQNAPSAAAVQAKWRDQYAWARRLTAAPRPDVKPSTAFEPLDLSTAPVFAGLREFRPLNKPREPNSNVLMPRVNNTTPQPLRRAMAQPAQEALLMAAPAPIMMSAMVTSTAQEAFGAPPPKVEAEPAKPKEEPPKATADPPKPTTQSSVKTEHTHDPAPIMTPHKNPIDEATVSREWYVDDVVERLALDTSFTVVYFVGKFENSDSLVGLMMAPTFANLNHVFAAPIEACDNCEKQGAVAHKVSSTSPITSILLDYVSTGELASMRPEHVRPFLIANLKWRVITMDGRIINPRELSANHGFKNSVSCKVSPLPGQTGEVVYETYKDIPEEIIRLAT